MVKLKKAADLKIRRRDSQIKAAAELKISKPSSRDPKDRAVQLYLKPQKTSIYASGKRTDSIGDLIFQAEVQRAGGKESDFGQDQ